MITSEVIQLVVRHFLTALAGGFFIKYSVDGATQDVIISGLTAMAGLGWSIYNKKDKLLTQ